MKHFLSGVLALVLTAALSCPARAGASAQIIRAFVYDGTLYTYMSIDGTEKPVTKAEVKIGSQTFAASGRLETVRQAGSPVTCLLLVDNSNSMPAFRQEAEDFAESLAQSGGENSRFILAAFGDTFAIAGEDVPAEELAEAVKSLPLDEKVTRLHTAIDQAIDYFESVPREGNELRCLVVLSDGVQYDPNGGIPYEELLEKVEQSDVMLHSVGLGDDIQALESLGKLAGASGGLHQVLDGALSPQLWQMPPGICLSPALTFPAEHFPAGPGKRLSHWLPAENFSAGRRRRWNCRNRRRRQNLRLTAPCRMPGTPLPGYSRRKRPPQRRVPEARRQYGSFLPPRSERLCSS